MNEKDWDDYVKGNATGYNAGSVMGQVGADAYDERKRQQEYASSFTDSSISGATESGSITATPGASDQGSIDDHYLFVDRILAKLPPWTDKFLTVLGLLAGAIAGASIDQGTAAIVSFAVVGGVAGFFLISFTRLMIKILIAITLAVSLLAAIYYMFQYLDTLR